MRPENPRQFPEKQESIADMLLYEAIIAAGGFVNNFMLIVPQPENKGFAQPPYTANTNALLYELVLAIQNGGPGGSTNQVFVDDNL